MSMNKRVREWFIWAYWPVVFALAVVSALVILGLADRWVGK